MKLAAALLTCFSFLAQAQTPQVPHKMQFAGITLTIRDDARREIQKDVDMLTRSPKHLNIKVERAKTYFPIIEKIFEEERVPDDFKYLVLQESALISDAVSVSNAVGFWQFKDFTAIEMGLRVDKEVDERMNIVSSSRAAAKYLKKNNYYFNNWVYALQAYQMGAGGVMKAVKDYESGTKHMEITSKTYWYVKKYLAHKVAYENAVNGPGEVKMLTLVNQQTKSLSELAKEFALEEEELKAYNKWVRNNTIPGDRAYTVAIPSVGNNKGLANAVAKASKPGEQPVRIDAKPATAKEERLVVNGIPAMKAHGNESITAFVKRAGVELSYFLKCNDLSISDRLIAGEYYYLKKKKARASVQQHVVTKEDNLWSISQRYGVQLQKLKKYNELSAVREGMIVFLAGKGTAPKKFDVSETIQVDTESTFNWAVKPEVLQTSTTPVIVVAPEALQPERSTSPADTTSQAGTPEVVINPNVHTVSAGETLYAISKKYNVGVMDLVNWNSLNLETGIKTGQVLQLQPQEEVQRSENTPQEVVHLVKASDTLHSVARQYGVTIKELMEWNQKKDFSLSVGENLKILKK